MHHSRASIGHADNVTCHNEFRAGAERLIMHEFFTRLGFQYHFPHLCKSWISYQGTIWRTNDLAGTFRGLSVWLCGACMFWVSHFTPSNLIVISSFDFYSCTLPLLSSGLVWML